MQPMRNDAGPHDLARMNRDNFLAMVDQMGKLSSVMQVMDDGEFIWTFSDIPHPLLNAVVETRAPWERMSLRVHQLVSTYRSRNLPLMWLVWPGHQQPDPTPFLQALGLTAEEAQPCMTLDLLYTSLDSIPASEYTVITVDDVRRLDVFCGLMVRIFNLPPPVIAALREVFLRQGFGGQAAMRNFLVYRGDEAVGMSSLNYAAGVAGIYNVGIVPDHRGKGMGRAVTLKPLHEARSRGYRWATLQASALGLALYRQMGFREHGQRITYL